MDIHCQVFLPSLVLMFVSKHLYHKSLRTPIPRPMHLEWLSQRHWPLQRFYVWHLLSLLPWKRYRGIGKKGTLGIVLSDRVHLHKPIYTWRQLLKKNTSSKENSRRKVGSRFGELREWGELWLPQPDDLGWLGASVTSHLKLLVDWRLQSYVASI